MQQKTRFVVRKTFLILGLVAVAAGVGVQHLSAEDALPDPVKRGAKVYAQSCAQCHGNNMVNPGNASFDLRTFPVNQHDRFIYSLTNGKRAMPAWDGIVTQAQMEDLWAYVSAKPGSTASPKK